MIHSSLLFFNFHWEISVYWCFSLNLSQKVSCNVKSLIHTLLPPVFSLLCSVVYLLTWYMTRKQSEMKEMAVCFPALVHTHCHAQPHASWHIYPLSRAFSYIQYCWIQGLATWFSDIHVALLPRAPGHQLSCPLAISEFCFSLQQCTWLLWSSQLRLSF